MSVLVEAVCLVTKQYSVVLTFPNGVDASLLQAAMMDSFWNVATDDSLIVASVHGPYHLAPLLAEMLEVGLIHTHDEGVGDYVFVDMGLGTIVPSVWLFTEPHRNGCRVASLTGGDCRITNRILPIPGVASMSQHSL